MVFRIKKVPPISNFLGYVLWASTNCLKANENSMHTLHSGKTHGIEPIKIYSKILF